MVNKQLTEKLSSWYNAHKRDLPWRKTRDPFRIWLSEVILQQTRVAQGLPYYMQFIENFSDVSEMAKADEQQILRLWQGLGYYSRARNLHRCAKEVVEIFDGKFPKTHKNLQKLSGIGPYTAAAIASFAFKEQVAVVDGNVYRVLSRIFGIHDDIATGKGQKVFAELAQQLVPEDRPDIHNQAIMEFGALHCTPKSPGCADCIFSIECYARKNNLQNELPVKSKKTKIKSRHFQYIVFKWKDCAVMKKRSDDDIWKGLYDFPLVESEAFISYEALLENNELLTYLRPYIENVEISTDFKHVLTHRRIFARFYTVSLLDNTPAEELFQKFGLRLFDETAMHHLPKPVLVSRYLNGTIF